jgi:hypothetical protein
VKHIFVLKFQRFSFKTRLNAAKLITSKRMAKQTAKIEIK